MEIKEYKEYQEDEIQTLYAAVGWTAYTEDLPALERGFQNSLLVLAAYEDGELIGLIRAVGDGATVVFVRTFSLPRKSSVRASAQRCSRPCSTAIPTSGSSC